VDEFNRDFETIDMASMRTSFLATWPGVSRYSHQVIARSG